MKKFQAINHYLSTYNHIYTDIVHAIMGTNCTQNSTFDTEIEIEKEKLAEFLVQFRKKKH
jgi:hypothetical protein